MKFSLFVHMERVEPHDTHRDLFDQLTELVQMAEAGGMETAWIGEHHGMEFTISPNPFVNIAYLAAKTSRIRLGTGTVIAPFWHPIRLAGEAAMTDIATQGRLDLGIARGAYSYEYERMLPGLDAMEAGARMRELIPALQGLWKGDYAHDGKFHQFPSTTPVPGPVQQSGPPIWVAARDPNTHEFAVTHGCNVQVTPLWQGDGEVEHLMATFNAACAANPGVPRPKCMLLRHTFVGEDAAEVDVLHEGLRRYYNYFGAWFKNEKPVSQGFIQKLTQEEMDANPMMKKDALRRDLAIGTADEVTRRVRHAEALGYDQYAVWIDGGIPFEQKKKSLQLFIDRVMPEFSDNAEARRA
ncbi:LLM class flavin-dependent oxidoreductase [Pelagivirga sediminicola]|uniref:LLM class flavin-dependent oxidoreductase n=1 Tax=Pelagivirga sediminicola TaxID=2170575 RepID=A0A2T7G884_9RHOB|nr:LLM class flavin-dependent oxidoreductase [Pelagivirga sediminicola]PVA10629.1 LLM class flavin-dependent oxidoreductase [Pelagivirga sediminicola]